MMKILRTYCHIRNGEQHDQGEGSDGVFSAVDKSTGEGSGSNSDDDNDDEAGLRLSMDKVRSLNVKNISKTPIFPYLFFLLLNVTLTGGHQGRGRNKTRARG